MNNIVLQPHGIGDHIFCQQLIKEIANGPIIWPVLDKFLPGLKAAYPDVTWIPTGIIPGTWENIKRDQAIQNNRIIPIRFADQIQRVPYQFCMRSKYDMYQLDWKTWNQTMYCRNMEKELQLFDLVVSNPDEPFCLVNRNFTSVGNKAVQIKPDSGLQIVEMQEYSGYSLFDWSLVIEKATEIHTVSTSIIYLLELLDLKCKDPHIYIRRPDESNHKNYDYILRKHHYQLMN
jgi:hypothetical protein